MKMLLSCVCVVVSALVASGGQFQPSQVSADAQWAIHVDVELLKGADLGKFILDELGKDEPARKLAAFQAIVNFDPRKDLTSLTLYGKDGNPNSAVLLVRGTFDTQRLITLVRGNDSYQESKHGDHVIHSWIDKARGGTKRSFGCVHPNGTVIIASEQLIKDAADVLDGAKPNVAALGTFKELAAEKGAFLMGVANLAGMAGVEPHAAVLQQATAGQLVVSENASTMMLNLTLTGKTPDAAQQIDDVAKGLIGFALLNQEKDPAWAKLAKNIAVTVNGTSIRLTLASPASDVVSFIKEKKAMGPEREGKGAAEVR